MVWLYVTIMEMLKEVMPNMVCSCWSQKIHQGSRCLGTRWQISQAYPEVQHSLNVEELAAANESDFDKSPNPTLLSIPATLLVVVLLSNVNFWMVADASYCGLGIFNQSFMDVKPSCLGGIPDVKPFKTDFAEVIANIRWLMDTIVTRGFKQKEGFSQDPDGPTSKFIMFYLRYEHVSLHCIEFLLNNLFLQQNGKDTKHMLRMVIPLLVKGYCTPIIEALVSLNKQDMHICIWQCK